MSPKEIFGYKCSLFVRRRAAACVVPTVKHGGGVMVALSDLFRTQGTLSQHGYHSILQWYAIPSVLRLVGRSLVFQQDNGYLTKESDECCIRWPGLHNHLTSTQLRWVGPQSEGKAANKCSAHVETTSRLLEIAFLMKLVERIPWVGKAVKVKGWLLSSVKQIKIDLRFLRWMNPN
jgi:hypothetical protein